jgi:hypothetical protein
MSASLEQQIKSAAEKAILHSIASGNFFTLDYSGRTKITAEFMADVWRLVDHEKVKMALAARLEVELAERIVNHLAAEMATDIKQILGVPERREALRAIARENINRICNPDPQASASS